MSENQNIKETHKPHIQRLPIVEFPDYDFDGTAVAVSIPLFHSPVDSKVHVPIAAQRMRDIHAKGAIWSAISMIRNTDISQNGVGIYFHIEDKVFDMVIDVFEEFKVPSKFIRKMSIDAPVGQIKHPHFGKKMMCIEDSIETERWLISDSDTFFCSTENRIDIYDRLKVFENPSTFISEEAYYTHENYNQWVHGVCFGAGIPFFPDENLRLQEKRAFYSLGHWRSNYRLPPLPSDPNEKIVRTYICTQMLLLPMQHKIIDHLKEAYKKSYHDEFLFGLWQLTHRDISDLGSKLGDPKKYLKESEYVNRDKSLDKDGYIAHIVPDNNGDALLYLDEYYDDFFDGLTRRESLPITSEELSGEALDAITGISTMRQFGRISEYLAESGSDKEDPSGHRYGKFYDMLFESLLFKLGRPLRVLEIGVSAFGGGSLEAFQKTDMVSQVVGVDIITYTGELSDKSRFHKMDGYQQDTIDYLHKEYPDGFDIVIDDGTHHPDHQRFFLDNYVKLLSSEGKLVCEDISDIEFFDEMSLEEGCYGINLQSNLPNALTERIIVRDKTAPAKPSVANSQPVAFTEYTPPAQKHFIVLDIPYAHSGFIACAFVQRVEKWCKAMMALGHKITFIGHKDRNIACSEHIAIMDDDILTQAYGSADYLGVPPNHEIDDPVFTTFQDRATDVIRSIAQEDDFVLPFYGWGHFETCKAIKDLPVIIVEPSIGYPDTFSENKVYQSVGKMHFERGKAHINHKLAGEYPDHPYNQHPVSMYNRMSLVTPDRNSCVIPNFFDFDVFEYREEKEDLICFVGRIKASKGLQDVFNLAEYTDTPLIVAGTGFLEDLPFKPPPQVEFVGAVDAENRSKIYASAKVHVCPSDYLEPFLGAGVESLFAGTAHITTNWGAGMDWCIHGKTGYRVQNFDQLVWAFENIDKISPKDCRHQALQYSKERAAISYHEYFNMLLQNKNGGRWSVNPNRTHLDWLVADMTEEQIRAATVDIQKQVKGS